MLRCAATRECIGHCRAPATVAVVPNAVHDPINGSPINGIRTYFFCSQHARGWSGPGRIYHKHPLPK